MPLAAMMETMIQAVPWSMPAAVDSLSVALRAWSQQAALIAVTTLWQGVSIAVGLAVLLRLAPRTSAEHRFSIWAAAFVTLAGLPLLKLISDFPGTLVTGSASLATGGALAPGPASALAARLSQPWLSIDARWSLLIAASWVAATLYRAADLALHSFRLRKLWEKALPVELDSRLGPVPAPIATSWHRRPVEVCTTSTLQRPSVIGFFKPRILIPDWLFARLTSGELEQIVLHEAEHLRRHDDWTNLFQKLCLVLFPLNPALVWIEHRLCREREMACDEGVVRITRAPRAYAACLASLAERGLQHRVEALSLGAWQRRPELVHRVHSILRRKHTQGPLGNRALLGTLGCSLLFGAIELARCPQLIAFVPERNQARNLDATNIASPAQLQAAPGSRPGYTVVNAAYVPVRSAAAGQAYTAANAAKAEAILPGSGSAHGNVTRASMQLGGVRQDAALFSRAQSYRPDSHAPRAIMLKAELPSAQPDVAEGQWIVVATFEQVESSNQNAGLVADYETGANANAASGEPGKKAGNGQPSTQPAGQITVTRLILRFIPASSISNSVASHGSNIAANPAFRQPAIVPTRNGWLVLQL